MSLNTISDGWPSSDKTIAVRGEFAQTYLSMIKDNFRILVDDTKRKWRPDNPKEFAFQTYFKRDITPPITKDSKSKISMADAFIVKSLLDASHLLGDKSRGIYDGMSIAANNLSLIEICGFRLGVALCDEILDDFKMVIPSYGVAPFHGGVLLGLVEQDQSMEHMRMEKRLYGCMASRHAPSGIRACLIHQDGVNLVIKRGINRAPRDVLSKSKSIYESMLDSNVVYYSLRDGIMSNYVSSFGELLASIYGIFLVAVPYKLRRKQKLTKSLGETLLLALATLIMSLRDRLSNDGIVGSRLDAEQIRYYFQQLQNRFYYRIVRNFLLLPLEFELHYDDIQRSEGLVSAARRLWNAINNHRKSQHANYFEGIGEVGVSGELPASKLSSLGTVIRGAVDQAIGLPYFESSVDEITQNAVEELRRNGGL